MMFVFPADPLNPNKPDPHFAPEYQAAKDLGHPTALIDHDALVRDELFGVAADLHVGETHRAVYRGLMVTSKQYEEMSIRLGTAGIHLVTNPSQFSRGHEFPGWAKEMSPFMADFSYYNGTSWFERLVTMCLDFDSGSAVIRDHVKSAKHTPGAMFIEDVHDRREIRKVHTAFMEDRGSDFTGGFVVRRFENYNEGEVRTWWFNGLMGLATPHPDTPDLEPVDFEFPEGAYHAISDLGLPFITVDFAQRDDGVWRVIEVGDGQVSDRPSSLNPVTLIVDLSSLDAAS